MPSQDQPRQENTPPNGDANTFGVYLRLLRHQQGVSLRTTVIGTDFTAEQWSGIERHHENPTDELVAKIARLLELREGSAELSKLYSLAKQQRAAFNPRRFGALLSGAPFVSSDGALSLTVLLPKIVDQLAHTDPPTHLGEREAAIVESFHKVAKNLWDRIQKIAHHVVHERWAAARKDQNESFFTYLYNGRVSREDALEVLKSLGPLFEDIPPARHVKGESAKGVYEQISKVPYQLVLEVLPDLTDAEAARLFGQPTTVSTVREKALKGEEI